MTISIFLVDDHPVLVEGLSLLLETQPNFKVVGISDNGRDAVRQVAQCRPEIVFMDITMPELNGLEAMRQIQQVCPATHVIILSMHGTDKHILPAFQAGARGYLLKESAGTEVIKAVHAVHANQRYLSQKISDQTIEDYLRQSETDEAIDPLAQLSPREREVFQLVVEGNSSSEIAGLLSLSPSTVKTYRSRLMQKLNLCDLPSLVKFAVQHGLTPPA